MTNFRAPVDFYALATFHADSSFPVPVRVQRIYATNNLPLTPADIAITGSWGAGAEVFLDSGSNDQHGRVRVITGTAPASSPGWVLTFNGGVWPVAPFAVVVREAATTQPSVTVTTTTLAAAQSGAIPAESVILYDYLVLG